MEEITELENKYFVLKNEDIEKYLALSSKKELMRIDEEIRRWRAKEGKKENDYVILNLDDEIDIIEIRRALYNKDSLKENHVRDIAVALVNSILKVKENK